jgi:hypothetical protein
MIDMTKLILGTAIGYQPDQLEPFVISLRRFYQGPVGLLVVEVNDILKEFFKKYNITPYLVTPNVRKIKPVHIFNFRHKEYLKIIESLPSVDRIFLTDIRDVFFQDDPFKHHMDTDLEFFLEPILIKDSEFAMRHMVDQRGKEFSDSIGDNYVACCGTTMGTRAGITEYLKEMIKELERLSIEKGQLFEDQATHNFLIYTNKVSNYRLYHTCHGPVATLHYKRKGVFNEDGDIINEDGSLTPIVHQWDRLKDNAKEHIYNKIMSYKE